LNIYYWPVKVLITLKVDDLSEITDWVVIPSELESIFKGSKITIGSVELYSVLCEWDLKVDI
jgi:ABC-type nitrate/sulfonate/bicarbonate transport system permease component